MEFQEGISFPQLQISHLGYLHGFLTLEDGSHRLSPKHLWEIITTQCLIAQKRTFPIYILAEVLNHELQLIACKQKVSLRKHI